jgi:hypothetical protein
MKKEKQNSPRDLRRTNRRWKWMAGATAATAAGATAAQASLITVNLSNNYISGGGGNHLNADLTGDGYPDLVLTGASFYYRYRTKTLGNSVIRVTYNSAKVDLNGVHALGFRSAGDGYFSVAVMGSTTVTGTSLTASIPIFFKDLHINGGAPTKGSLEVTAGPFAGGQFAGVRLDSFTYTSNTPVAGSRIAAVPDQGSSLALLAMGAGGVLALRRRRAAQGNL